MGSAAARRTYKQRAATAEWANAQARNHGLQRFIVRGMAKAKVVLLWFALAHSVDLDFQAAYNDPHNLFPAGARSMAAARTTLYGTVAGEPRAYGCRHFELSSSPEVAEPARRVGGEPPGRCSTWPSWYGADVQDAGRAPRRVPSAPPRMRGRTSASGGSASDILGRGVGGFGRERLSQGELGDPLCAVGSPTPSGLASGWRESI